jgi:hypothetical protein
LSGGRLGVADCGRHGSKDIFALFAIAMPLVRLSTLSLSSPDKCRSLGLNEAR